MPETLTRRGLLRGAGQAGVGVVVAVTGIGAGTALEAAGSHNQNHPDRAAVKAFFTQGNLRDVQREAIKLSDLVITPKLSKDSEQGPRSAPTEPKFNTPIIVEAALLFAGALGGKDAAQVIADSLKDKKKGLEVRFASSPSAAKDGQKPYEIVVDDSLKDANAGYEGEAAAVNHGDFQVLKAIRQYVLDELSAKQATGISELSTPALVTDAGLVAGATLFVDGATEAVTPRRITRRALGTATLVGGTLWTLTNRFGGRIQTNIGKTIAGGPPDLGGDYDHIPNGPLKQLVDSRIRGHLINQAPQRH